VGDKVIVVGGGNTAADAAIICRRLGVGDVKIVCLEKRSEMPAFEREILECEEDDIQIENGWGPLRFRKEDNGKIGIEFSRCTSLFDSEGNFRPLLEDHTGLTLEADSVILAVGQKRNREGIPDEYFEADTGVFSADPLTLQSNANAKVFVCGDAHQGSTTVVEALASGAEAACSANRFLRNDGLRWGRDYWNGPFVRDYEPDLSRANSILRNTIDRLPVNQRTFLDEVEQVLLPQTAREQAERCLSCGRAFEANQTCWYCLPCEIECPVKALNVRIPYLVR
jgi:NADPH-dependent glutamate synthase beta subunit-like oxidoreductase